MGTNYYLASDDECPTCHRSSEPLHIGKSSMGWCFSLHVIPESGINSLDDWKPLLRARSISDEYGRALSANEMLDIITERTGRGFATPQDERMFHAENHSEPGPKGLVRNRIGDSCVSHGEGPWDCIVGEFS